MKAIIPALQTYKRHRIVLDHPDKVLHVNETLQTMPGECHAVAAIPWSGYSISVTRMEAKGIVTRETHPATIGPPLT